MHTSRDVSASPAAHSRRRWHCWPYHDVPGPRRDRDLWTPHRLDVGQRVRSSWPSILTEARLRLSHSACPHFAVRLSFSRYMCFVALARCNMILTKSRCHRSYRPILIRQWTSSLRPPLKNGALQGELARDRPLKAGPLQGSRTPRQQSRFLPNQRAEKA